MNIDRLAFKIANGDEKAFEDIYRALNKLVFSVCYAITRITVIMITILAMKKSQARKIMVIITSTIKNRIIAKT